MKITNGATIKFTGEDEEFTVSQWNGERGWAGDEDGAGWYFTSDDQVTVVATEEDEE